MTLHHLGGAVSGASQGAFAQAAQLRTQAHGATQVGLLRTLVGAARRVLPFGDETDDRVWRCAIELRAVGALEAEHVSRILNASHLHAQADTEERHLVFARPADGLNFAFNTPFAEAARHQHSVDTLQTGGAITLDIDGIDVAHVHAGSRLHASMLQRFG